MSLRPATDGVVSLRPPGPGDAALLIAGRDEVFHRWFGPGAAEPQPTACIVVDGAVVGWVDFDRDVDHDWLAPGEVNVGYNVFAAHRRRGYASRAVVLLLERLAEDTDHRTATLLIDPGNEASLALAARLDFIPGGEVNGQRRFERPIGPPPP